MHLNDFNLNNESFDIEPELIVSKIINERSEVIYTNKNTLDPYGYDLNCFNKINNNFVGYVEVERSKHKILGRKGTNWKHSFLMRKILVYNENQYHDQILKDNADKTIYIKFNKNYGLDDCICCCIEDITFFDSEWQRKTGDVRKDLVFRTSQYNSKVAKGIDNCIIYIDKFFNEIMEK